MSQTFYAALVLAGGASYGIISTLVKLSYRSGFSINDVSSIQYFLGFLLLWTIWLLRVRRFPAKKTALAFLLTGIPLSGTTMLYNRALETLPASLAVIFLFQSIWLGTLAECVIRREKPTRIRLLSIAIVLAGTVLGAGVIGSAAAFPLSIGMLWGFAAAISYTTGVPAMIGTMMVVNGLWNKPGVYTTDEFDPDPYMEALNKWGLPWKVVENPVLVD